MKTQVHGKVLHYWVYTRKKVRFCGLLIRLAVVDVCGVVAVKEAGIVLSVYVWLVKQAES